MALEELIRSIAEGKVSEQPETVLAMLQARIGRLSTGVRRSVRAAAVFGQTFFQGGLAAILGIDKAESSLATCLATLVEAELIQPQTTSRLAQDTEYLFRHALVREAAYGLLTAEDLTTGHRLAAEFLVSVGERDVAVIAEHFERSGDAPRAVTWYVRAAEDAHGCGNLPGVQRHVENGVRCGAAGPLLGVLRSIESRMYLFMNRYDTLEESAAVALATLKPGSHYWSRALLSAFLGALRHPSSTRSFEVAALLVDTQPDVAAYSAYCDTLSMISMSLALTPVPGTLLQRQWHRLSQIVVQAEARKPTIRRTLCMTRAFMMIHREPGSFTLVREAQQAIALAEQAGDQVVLETLRGAIIEWGFLDLGDDAGVRQRLLALTAMMQKASNTAVISLWQHMLGRALCHSSDAADWDRAERLVTPLLTQTSGFVAQPYLACGVLARVALQRGNYAEAATQAQTAMQFFAKLPGWMSHVAPVQIQALLALARVGEAVALSEEVLRVIAKLGGCGVAEVELRLAASQAFAAAGDLTRGKLELRETLRQIQIRADDVADAFWKHSYLTRNPHCVRAQALAREWGLEANAG